VDAPGNFGHAFFPLRSHILKVRERHASNAGGCSAVDYDG
jgi:hypothetical protein